jgi:hypothetical protein
VPACRFRFFLVETCFRLPVSALPQQFFHSSVKGDQAMSRDALPPSLAASRSLTSFVQELDSYDPEDNLFDGLEETKGLEPANVLKYLRCMRGFLTSARARIIEAQLQNMKQQLATLSGPIQELSENIFLLERGGKQTPEELRNLLTEKIKTLLKCREQINTLVSELNSVK